MTTLDEAWPPWPSASSATSNEHPHPQEEPSMAMAATQPRRREVASSTSTRMWRLIESLPTNPDGSIHFRPGHVDHAVGAATQGHATTILSQREKRQGDVTVLRHGRHTVGVRMRGALQKGSQTERIRAVLVAYADDHGKVRLDANDLVRLVGARDTHDTTKALYDLAERGVLTFKKETTGAVKDIKLTKTGRELRLVAVGIEVDAKSMPAIVNDREGYARDMVMSEVANGRGKKRPAGPTPVVTMDAPDGLDARLKRAGAAPDPTHEPPAKVTASPSNPVVAEPPKPEPEPTPPSEPRSWALDPRYPLIDALLKRPAQFEKAAETVAALGPEYEAQALELMGKAEDCYTPFEAEVVAFVKDAAVHSVVKETR